MQEKARPARVSDRAPLDESATGARRGVASECEGVAYGEPADGWQQIAGLLVELHDAERSRAEAGVTQAVEALVARAKPLKGMRGRCLGMLSGCAIGGCDVHTLDRKMRIVRHFRHDESVPKGYELARAALRGCEPNTIAIVVYENHLERLLLNGTRQRL